MKKVLSLMCCIAIMIVCGSESFAAIKTQPATYKVYSNGTTKYKVYDDEDYEPQAFILQNDITVVEIPEEVDGYPITKIDAVHINSPSVTKVIYGKNVRTVSSWKIMSEQKSNVPVCSITLNNGLEKIEHQADYSNLDVSYELNVFRHIKLLILPETLQTINYHGLYLCNYENLVVNGDISAQEESMTVNGYYELVDSQDLVNPYETTNVYFTGNSTNFHKRTFDFTVSSGFVLDPADNPFVSINEKVRINRKPNAVGFDVFSKKGYTVKEYTEEWWHDLAEIETVTMTAEGMTEITKNKGKGLSDAAKKYLSHEYKKSVKSGETFTVSSAFAPADAYDNRTFFVSMNEDIATVDIETGEVKALKKGTARIRCVAASGVFADCILTVDGGDGTNGVKPTEAEVEANDTTSAATTAAKTDTPTATQSKTQPNKALSFLADKKFYIIPAAVVLTAAVVAGCIVRKKKR